MAPGHFRHQYLHKLLVLIHIDFHVSLVSSTFYAKPLEDPIQNTDSAKKAITAVRRSKGNARNVSRAIGKLSTYTSDRIECFARNAFIERARQGETA